MKIEGNNPDTISPDFAEEYPNETHYKSKTGITNLKAKQLPFGVQVANYEIFVKKLDISKLLYNGEPITPDEMCPNGYGLSWKKFTDYALKAIAYGPGRSIDWNNPNKKDGTPKPLLIFDKAENFDDEGYLTQKAHRQLQNELDGWSPTTVESKAEKDAKMKADIKTSVMDELGLTPEQFEKMVERQKKKTG